PDLHRNPAVGLRAHLPDALSRPVKISCAMQPGQGPRPLMPVEPEECPIMYLELAPAITALRSRPEEFEFSHDTLHHLPSRHRFPSDGDVHIEALGDCSLLRAKPEQARALHDAYRDWHASYWRPLEINREFAAHFEAPPLWRRVAIWLLQRLIALPPAKPAG